MNAWENYARSLLEVAPSRILASLLGEHELPERWRHLSSFPVTEKHDLEKFVLKHPISAREKFLEKLSDFWFSVSDEERLEFVEVLRKSEKVVAERIANSSSVEEFAKLWNEMPNLLQKEYEKSLDELGLNPAMAEEIVHLPADPHVPDHDWLSRLDVYAVLSRGKASLLRFKISPVQGFIGNARTERDLWAGSHLLSLLTYLAISELWRKIGPNALIFPHLRSQPFFEHELGEIGDDDKLDIANIPNKVLAIVPEDTNVGELKEGIEREIRDFMEKLLRSAWNFYEISNDGAEIDNVYLETVRDYFSITVEAVPLEELQEVFEKSLRDYLGALPDGFENEVHHYSELFAILDQNTDFHSAKHFPPEQPMGFKCTLCGENLAIGGDADHETVRNRWNSLRDNLRSRGIYDIKEGERLCPICLVKRFYPRFYSLWKGNYRWISGDYIEISDEAKNEHGRGSVRLKRFASVSEVAIRRPTEKALELKDKGELSTDGRPVTWHDVFLYTIFHTKSRSEWRKEAEEPKFEDSKSGEFTKRLMALSSTLMPLFKGSFGPNSEVLYSENVINKKALAKVYGVPENRLPPGTSPEAIGNELSKVSEFLGEAPKYYALLKMDGDNMGKVISGSKAVKSVTEYTAIENSRMEVKRPATPTVHIAITRSLSEFAIGVVPDKSEEHDGELLYAGGDDVFAIVPTDRVFDMAFEIQRAFRDDWKEFRYLQGKTRSMSAGLLILHYKEPFYIAVRRVNELEHMAKESGRNALAIGYLKHSGSYHRIVINWGVFGGDHYKNTVRAIRSGKISNKFIYELDTRTWPNDALAVLMLLKYELERHSNYKKDEVSELVNRFAELLWLVRNVRVTISASDVEDVIGRSVGKEAVDMINEAVRSVIVDDPEREEPTDSFNDVRSLATAVMKGEEPKGNLWFRGLEEKISNVLTELGLPSASRELAGAVVRKQVAGASKLLKVLLEAGVRA